MEKVLGEKQPRKAASLFGKYRLLRSLKRSPFLENHLVQTESPPHTVAVLKRLHPLVVHRTDWVSLFLNEVKQAATLWHPNIIRIYDLGQNDGIPYFVQPYLFGKKLQTLLSRSRSLPIPTGMALLLVRQLLEALDFAHGTRRENGRAMAHGGLHPERIFVGFDGLVQVGDFGLGWLDDPRSAIRSRYRAPESIPERKGGEMVEATPAEDLFAVSAILCELLGEFPEPIKPGMEPWGYLPASVRSILIRGLAIDPSARFQTAREMIGPIESILQNEYPRLNLSNYIQAFFGKEIEAERRVFAQFASTEGGGSPVEVLLFERVESPVVPAPTAMAPDLSREPAPETSAAPAVSTVPEEALPPAESDRPAAEETERLGEVAPKKKASPWQPVWWSLFGLLMAGFVGVLFFSLYRSPSQPIISSTPPASPSVVAVQPPPIDLPAPAAEGVKEESIQPPLSFQGEVPSPQPVVAQPTPPEPVPSPVKVPAVAVAEAVKGDSSIEKPSRTKEAVTLPVPSDSSTVPSKPIAPSDASVAAIGKRPMTLKEGIPPQPKVEEIPPRSKTNEEMLHELIERQRRAFQTQGGALVRQDLAEGKGGFERQTAELFVAGRPVRVEFEIFELKVRGEEADLSLMQTARLQKGPAFFLQKSLLFWKLKKENDRWKIEKFNIVDKYPPIEVG